MPRPSRRPASGRRRIFSGFFRLLELVLFAGLIYVVLSQSVVQPYQVEMRSMVPTVPPGTYIMIDKITPTWDGHEYERGDIVVLEPPDGGTLPYIKRVIGLPGETVSIVGGRVWISSPGVEPFVLNEPYINAGPGVPTGDAACPARAGCDAAYEVPAGHYFVLGDNRPSSSDSRAFGPVPADMLIGRAWIRYFPIPAIGIVERPEYVTGQ